MRRSGFTLVELSIVLVIIGLLVGGVLTGRDLIQAARIRATIAQYEKFQTTVNTFQVKYDALPGDLTPAQAIQFNLPPTTRAGSPSVNNVPGNGLIEGCDQFELFCESAYFWHDLSAAGLIAESIRVANGNGGSTGGAIGDYYPPSKISGANWALTADIFGTASLRGINQWYYIGGISGSPGSQLSAPALSVIEAYNIDSKIDDGKPEIGGVIVSDYFGTNGFISNDLASGLNSNCAVSGAYALYGSKYKLDSNPGARACSLNLRF